MNHRTRQLFALLAVLAATPALAAPACPPGLPAGVFCGGKDLAAATAGTYSLDALHTAVIARVSHIGYSYSLFRFDKPEGTLTWDPAAPGRSKLTVAVDTASIDTPVPGFAAQLAGDEFLKSKAFPRAMFVSTAFRRVDGAHGKVTGDFTLLGETRPMIFDVTLIGAGKGFGKPRLGVEARGELDPKSFGLSPMLGDRIDLVVDAEFERKP